MGGGRLVHFDGDVWRVEYTSTGPLQYVNRLDGKMWAVGREEVVEQIAGGYKAIDLTYNYNGGVWSPAGSPSAYLAVHGSWNRGSVPPLGWQHMGRRGVRRRHQGPVRHRWQR